MKTAIILVLGIVGTIPLTFIVGWAFEIAVSVIAQAPDQEETRVMRKYFFAIVISSIFLGIALTSYVAFDNKSALWCAGASGVAILLIISAGVFEAKRKTYTGADFFISAATELAEAAAKNKDFEKAAKFQKQAEELKQLADKPLPLPEQELPDSQGNLSVEETIQEFFRDATQ